MRKLLVPSLALLAAACGEQSRVIPTGEPGGTLVVSTTMDPGTLFPPFVGTTVGKQITEQIYDYLADVGTDLDTHNEKGFRRGLADGWRWSADSLSLAFHINPRARWHDGRDVTARDVEFTFALNKNPALGGNVHSELANIDSVTVTDSLTPVFWFREKSPKQFLDAAAQMLILPAHQLEKIQLDSLRKLAPDPIGSGRFRFRRRWDKGASVEIVADTSNYRGRAMLDRVIWSISPDYPAAVTRLFRGEADLLDGLRPENVRELTGKANLRAIDLPGMDYVFLRFNLRDPANLKRPHPLFGDRELRRAITMSLNRSTLVRSVFDTFAVVPVGPVVRAYSTTDPRGAQLPFDSVRASRILDSLGWIRRGDGMRAKVGKDLAFTLTIPTHSTSRIRMGPLIQEQLRRMGIGLALENLERSTVGERVSRGMFDASLDVWAMPSSPDGMAQAWGTSGIGENGGNYGHYSNPRFDVLLDSAILADPATARERFTRAYAVINDDAPAVWLYEPRKIIGIHRRIRTTPMRPDAWWFGLADWSIPPSGRILRDRLPPPR